MPLQLPPVLADSFVSATGELRQTGVRHEGSAPYGLVIPPGSGWTTTARRHTLHYTQAAHELIAQTLARIRTHQHLLAA